MNALISLLQIPASSWWDDYQTTGKQISSPQDLYQLILILGELRQIQI